MDYIFVQININVGSLANAVRTSLFTNGRPEKLSYMIITNTLACTPYLIIRELIFEESSYYSPQSEFILDFFVYLLFLRKSVLQLMLNHCDRTFKRYMCWIFAFSILQRHWNFSKAFISGSNHLIESISFFVTDSVLTVNNQRLTMWQTFHCTTCLELDADQK